MARSGRGLPDNFALDLPEDSPVQIGDFLDEPPAMPVTPKPRPEARAATTEPPRRQGVVTAVLEGRGEEARVPTARRAQQPSVIRYQLNLTPRSRTMFEELVTHIRTYSPQSDARTSEVFQGIMTLLHSAMNELQLSDIPRRGAWGSVTARNFPGALSEAFEQAIVNEARKRGRG